MGLTSKEVEVIALTAKLADALGEVVGDGVTRDADLTELVGHIHAVQHAVMAQAAARAHPSLLRLLGGEVGKVPPARPRPDVRSIDYMHSAVGEVMALALVIERGTRLRPSAVLVPGSMRDDLADEVPGANHSYLGYPVVYGTQEFLGLVYDVQGVPS